MTFAEDVIKRLRDADAARPRSTQAAVGWSEAGGCRAHIGYRLSGTWPSDEPDNWAAIRGTAIHDFLETVAGGEGVLTEIDTEYRGIPGHADVVIPGAAELWDWKTTRLANSRLWRSDESALRQKRIQVNGYAAGLVDAGILPEDCKVGLIVIPVDGTFADWWSHQEPFDRALADEGADRLDQVREMLAAGERLPKEMPYQWCASYCEFASICRATDSPQDVEEITDPELAAAVARYGEATKQISALYKDKDGLADLIRGLRGTAGEWRISLSRPGEPKPVIDEDWIRADYAARGEDIPMTMKPGSAPRLSVTRLKAAK